MNHHHSAVRLLSAAAIALAALIVPCAVTLAQEAPAQPYQAVVTGDNVYVRSGQGDTYYPFGKLNTGDVVTVVDERFGWASVLTRGHAFRDFHAYVNADEIQPQPDGRSGIALGRVDVYAPNITRQGDPDGSWKWIARIPAETTVAILDKVDGSRNDFFRIRIPDTGIGCISTRFLRRATPEDIRLWQERVARETQASAQPPPETATGSVLNANDPAEAATGVADDLGARIPATAQPTGAAGVRPVTPDERKTTHVNSPFSLDEFRRPMPAQADPLFNQIPAEPIENLEPEPFEKGLGDTAPSGKILAEVTFGDLESAYEQLKREPIREAEIEPLRERFLAFLQSGRGDETQNAVAKARAQLLDARLELQRQMLALDELRGRVHESAQDVEAARIAVERAADYTAVGRITASSIYDGVRLPHMLRLTDPGTGRTIAYLKPEHRSGLLLKIGQLVGIVGEKRYDDSLRLTVIEPRRVDLLTPEK